MVYPLKTYSNELSVEHLKTMLRIRMVEQRIADKYYEQEIRCPTHLSIGQECTPAILSSFLSKEDLAVSSHRSHAHYLAKGGSLKKMISEIYGKANGCAGGKGGSMHLIDRSVGFMGSSAIVGNSIPLGVGLAMAIKLENTNNMSVIYFGDAATEEGVFFESLNFAALHNLPALFVCENNGYSVYSPTHVRQPRNRDNCSVASSIGLQSYKIDGNSPFELHNILKEAVENVKANSSPVFIESMTYRTLEHCGPNNDDYLGYRDELEILEWGTKDPIDNLVKILNLPESKINKLRENISEEIDLAFLYAQQSEFPDQMEAYSGEYL